MPTTAHHELGESGRWRDLRLHIVRDDYGVDVANRVATARV